MLIAQPVKYPRVYPWFLVLASLDVTLTWMLLGVGGREANIIASEVIAGAGLSGAIALKAVSVLTVLLICEVIGRRHDRAGRRLALTAVGLSAVPVALATVALAQYAAVFALDL